MARLQAEKINKSNEGNGLLYLTYLSIYSKLPLAYTGTVKVENNILSKHYFAYFERSFKEKWRVIRTQPTTILVYFVELCLSPKLIITGPNNKCDGNLMKCMD